MKKALLILSIFAIILGIICPVWAEAGPYDYQVKKLYSAPGANNKVVFDIPIEVKMLDVSEDANWYKVKIQFYLGPACFNYTGWAYIPVGQILAEREAELAAAESK